MEFPSSLPLVVVGIAGAVAGAIDVRHFKVPNLLTVPLLFSGFIYYAITAGVAGLQSSVIGALFGFGILFFLYLAGGVGAGDVKLLAGVGAWLRMPTTLHVFVVAALATGIYSLVLLAWQRKLGRALLTVHILVSQLLVLGRHLGTSDRVEAVVNQSDRRSRLVPFAGMIALGAVVIWFWHR